MHTLRDARQRLLSTLDDVEATAFSRSARRSAWYRKLEAALGDLNDAASILVGAEVVDRDSGLTDDLHRRVLELVDEVAVDVSAATAHLIEHVFTVTDQVAELLDEAWEVLRTPTAGGVPADRRALVNEVQTPGAPNAPPAWPVTARLPEVLAAA